MIILNMAPVTPGSRGLLSSLRFGFVLAVCLSASLGAREARADDVPDTVLLTNGGRVRGTVMVEDPQKGTSVKLLDGTVRQLAPEEVKQVVYGGGSGPVAPPAVLAPLPAPGDVPQAAVPEPATEKHTIKFVPYRIWDSFTIAVDPPGPLTCETPCQLLLEPGKHRIVVTGAARYEQELEIGAQDGVATLGRKTWAKEGFYWLGSGLGLALAGAVFVLLGSLEESQGDSGTQCNTYPSGSLCTTSGQSGQALTWTGAGMIIGGAAVAAIGLVIGAVGTGENKVLLREPSKAVADRGTRVRWLGLNAGPTPGGGLVVSSFGF